MPPRQRLPSITPTDTANSSFKRRAVLCPGGSDSESGGFVLEGGEELGRVGANELAGEVEVARDNRPVDAGGLQPVDRPVELGVDVPVVGLATQGDDAHRAVVLGVDVELLPFWSRQPLQLTGMPGGLGGGRLEGVISLDDRPCLVRPKASYERQHAVAQLRADLADGIHVRQVGPVLGQHQSCHLDQGSDGSAPPGLGARPATGSSRPSAGSGSADTSSGLSPCAR